MTRITKLPPWFPDWMNKRNLLITLVLGIAAAVFAMRTGEDRQAMQFARQRVGRLRRGGLYFIDKTKPLPMTSIDIDNVTIIGLEPNHPILEWQNKDLVHEQEVEVWEPNQTELCDLFGSAVTVDEEHGIKQEWHEPNEPECTAEQLDELMKYESTSSGIVEYPNSVEVAGPNELEYTDTMSIAWEWAECSSCNKKIHITDRHFCLQQYIPTWPQYIELDKELVITKPDRDMGDYKIEFMDVYPKGTKIYFK
jgi:hypothetical protein